MSPELVRIRSAIAELARFGLTIDSFTVEAHCSDALDELAITARHIATTKNVELPIMFPRTIAGIPVNVKRR